MNHIEKALFIHNLNYIFSLLGCTYKNIHSKYGDFSIPRTTLYRWMVKEDYPNTTGNWNDDILLFYNKYFEPIISDYKVFYQNKLINVQIKKNGKQEDILSQYNGLYYIYYFSNHYQETIHGGRILVKSHSEHITVRMVLGIQDNEQFKDVGFRDIFDNSITDEEALSRFKAYKNTLHTKLRQRCYFYEGSICLSTYNLKFEFSGKEIRKNHKQIVYLNITRKPQTTSKSYRGGLGLVLASPNENHADFRIYKMGLSICELSMNDENIKKVLRLNVNDYNRITLNVDQDQMWYDIVLLYEQKIFNNKNMN